MNRSLVPDPTRRGSTKAKVCDDAPETVQDIVSGRVAAQWTAYTEIYPSDQASVQDSQPKPYT